MFATFVLPNPLCGGQNYEIKLFELLISVLLPISIQISIQLFGVQVHVHEGFLRFGLSSKQLL